MEQVLIDVQTRLEQLAAENERLHESVQELQAAAPTSASTTFSVVDTRVLGKPSEFDGASKNWKDWPFVRSGHCQLQQVLGRQA